MRNSKKLLKSEISRSELPSASQGYWALFMLCFSYFTQNTPLFSVHCVYVIINLCTFFTVATHTIVLPHLSCSPHSITMLVVRLWLILITIVSHTYFFLFSLFFTSSAPAKLVNGHAQLDVPGLSQNEIGLLLSSHHQSQQAVNVKREPEDLRIDPKCPRSQKVSKEKITYNNNNTTAEYTQDTKMSISLYCKTERERKKKTKKKENEEKKNSTTNNTLIVKRTQSNSRTMHDLSLCLSDFSDWFYNLSSRSRITIDEGVVMLSRNINHFECGKKAVFFCILICRLIECKFLSYFSHCLCCRIFYAIFLASFFCLFYSCDRGEIVQMWCVCLHVAPQFFSHVHIT